MRHNCSFSKPVPLVSSDIEFVFPNFVRGGQGLPPVLPVGRSDYPHLQSCISRISRCYDDDPASIEPIAARI